MAKILQKIINEQIKTWELRGSGKPKIASPKGEPFPVITISREFGALGAALANLMGEKTNFKVWDKNILQAMAEELGSNQKYLEALDENPRELIGDMVVGFMTNVNTNVEYFRTLNNLVRTIEKNGNAVIVGRGANYICKKPESFHIRIVSTVDKRIDEYSLREEITKEEAESVILKKDKERKEFVRHYFKKDVTQSSDYDLILNSGTFNLQQMMQIAIEGYEQKTGLKLELIK